MTIIAIDPGNQESGWVVIDETDAHPLAAGKWNNQRLLDVILDDPTELLDLGDLGTSPARGDDYLDTLVIEMVASYGMPVGAEVFDTCVWIGRFTQAWEDCDNTVVETILRPDVKLHHTGWRGSKDSNVTAALVERFAPGQRNHGKGTKAAPGFFHGFKADIWQAYALAACFWDRQQTAAANQALADLTIPARTSISEGL